MKQKRLFIAVPLELSVKSKILQYIDTLKQIGLDLSWSGSESLHITLAFLDDTYTTQIPRIREIVDTVANSISSFDITLSQAGYFRNSGALWIGVDETNGLKQLATTLRNQLKEEGITFSAQYGFNPHLTIARNRKQIQMPNDFPDFPSITTTVQKIVLFESRLIKPRATYVALCSSHLKSGGKTIQ